MLLLFQQFVLSSLSRVELLNKISKSNWKRYENQQIIKLYHKNHMKHEKVSQQESSSTTNSMILKQVKCQIKIFKSLLVKVISDLKMDTKYYFNRKVNNIEEKVKDEKRLKTSPPWKKNSTIRLKIVTWKKNSTRKWRFWKNSQKYWK